MNIRISEEYKLAYFKKYLLEIQLHLSNRLSISDASISVTTNCKVFVYGRNEIKFSAVISKIPRKNIGLCDLAKENTRCPIKRSSCNLKYYPVYDGRPISRMYFRLCQMRRNYFNLSTVYYKYLTCNTERPLSAFCYTYRDV
jgi:hypothetical protein